MVRLVTTFDDSPERALEYVAGRAARASLMEKEGEDFQQPLLDAISLVRTYLVTCSCWSGNYDDYEGLQASCTVHGAVRAFNNAVKELEDVRGRIKNARDRALVASTAGHAGSEVRAVHRYYVKQFTSLLHGGVENAEE